jgi:GSH-dependent disulfide-bond oxidoreductase
MIDLYFFPTPNAHKVTIFLEEAGMPYRIVPIDILKGEQFNPKFLEIAPNNRIPAIVDPAPADGGEPISVFESAAILTYLADKCGQFLPSDVRGRTAVNEWLYWQMAGLGPNLGHWNYFARFGSERIPYAIERFVKEVNRLCGVLERRLQKTEFLAGAYSIADMAAFAWLAYAVEAGIDVAGFSRLRDWLDCIGRRPAVARGRSIGKELLPPEFMRPTAEMAKTLYGQTDDSVRTRSDSDSR